MAGLWESFLKVNFNFYSLVIFLAHKISFSCSPLLTELVELDRKNEQENFTRIQSQSYPIDIENSKQLKDEDSFTYYLLHPIKLIKLIKRYHGVGNEFFVLAFLHIILLCYLGSKSFFQILVIGDDPELAKYYSSSLYPRILESYPNPESFYKLCIIYLTYYVSLRVLCTHRLIDNAIKNRNGYKQITISQVNFSIAAVHRWTMKNWIDYTKSAFKHERLRASDKEAQKVHLSFDKGCRDKLMRNSKRELMYYNNMINFTECFGGLIEKFDPKYISSWASGWYMAKPVCRQDIQDAGRLFIIQLMGFSALLSALIILGVVFFIYEASRLTPNPDESTIAETIVVIPEFLTNFRSLVRYFDMMIIVIVQFPNHIEAGLIYWDMTVMISRTSKVCEAICEDLNFCINKALNYKHINSNHYSTVKRYSYPEGPYRLINKQEDYNIYEYDNMDHAEKKMLNEEIEVHVRLARILNLEFLDLKRTHTLYLNLLFVGSGFCISICLSLILVSKSSIVCALMAGLAFSCSIPVVGVVFFCVKAELVFRKLYRTMNKLVLNEGTYISRTVLKYIMTVSSQFERTYDRSFQIGGQYPITPGTLGPYIAYISTCIILVTRFL